MCLGGLNPNGLTGDYEVHVNEIIQKQIDDKAIKDTDLPWAS